MLILGIETSGTVGSVALMEHDQLLKKRTLAGQARRHAQALTSEMAKLFQDANRSPSDCQGVGISMGPGRFTGLRIGVTCAKTFAYAVGCPVAAVDSLQAIAEECPDELAKVTVIADAQRGDLYVGLYQQEDGQWVRLDAITFHPAKAWIGSLSRSVTVAGPGLERWAADFPADCSLLSDRTVPNATTICKIAARQFQAGDVEDLWGLEPYYLRKSSAEEQWEHRAKES